MLATARRIAPAFVRAYALSDEELHQIYVTNNQDLAANGGIPIIDGIERNWRHMQHVGGLCLHNGWSIVPQDRPGTVKAIDHGEGRRPSLIRTTAGGSGRTKQTTFTEAFYPTKWREQRMSLRQFNQLDESLEANLAIQCCPASGDIRCFDIDCRNEEVAERVLQLAFEHLGTTPFVRVGAAPKLMLLYRVTGEEELALPSDAWVLGDADGNPDLDGEKKHINVIEFLANGTMFTAYGLHHKTKKDFDWSRGTLHPAAAGPEHAPVVSRAMMRAFANAVHAFRPIIKTRNGVASNPYGGRAAVSEFTEKSDAAGRRLWVPKVAEGKWTFDDEGKVTDEAEAWLAAVTWAALAANTQYLDAFEDIVEEVTADAKFRLLTVHRDNKTLNTEAKIERAVRQKLKTSLVKWKASLESKARGGEYLYKAIPWNVADDGRRPMPMRIRSERPEDGSLDWLPQDTCPVDMLSDIQPKAKTTVKKKAAEAVADDKAARALIDTQTQRKATGDAVSAAVGGHIGDWLTDSVAPYLLQEIKEPQSPWVLAAPTGAGKTVSVLGKLFPFCQQNPRESCQGPILFVPPTHANAAEALATAERVGMITPAMEKEIDAAIVEGAKVGVRIVHFKGREASGCQRTQEFRALSDRGIRATGLCEARVPAIREGAELRPATDIEQRRAKRGSEKLETTKVLCPFRERGECAYYRQFEDLRTADIVIVSHAYLTMHQLPKELENPRAVVIDESTTYSLLQQARLPLSVLNAPRIKPYITKSDRKGNDGVSDETLAESMVQDREELCAIVGQWLIDGQDVAPELMKHQRCDTLLKSAITICDRSHTSDKQVRPDMDIKAVAKLVDAPVGQDLLLEIRFWKTVRDRIEGIRNGTAKGKTDKRWQLVMDWQTKINDDGDKRVEWTPHIRLSWRRGPNWAGVPMLLLDASANPRIITKTYGSAPVVRNVAAPLHVRTVAMIEKTWSNSSFTPSPDSTAEEIQKIAQTISEARKLITTTAVLYGHGRVLVGTTISVREVLTARGWTPPPNVDFVHYGALRGLDFAKGHAAAISIGRSEQPIGVIDGYRAALTYDDDEPEEPLDILGTGITRDGKILFRPTDWSTIRMRSGQDVQHLVPGMRGKCDDKGKPVLDDAGQPVRSWAQDLEQSWREEEIRQFVGRLRPVYRGTTDDLPPPVWLAVGKILPEGIVVDELVEMQSMIKISPMAELVRLGGGVLADNVTPRLPGAQDLLQGRDLEAMEKAVLPSDKRFRDRFAGAFQSISYELASEPGRRRSALVLAGWIDGNPVDAWLALSERYGELPVDLIEKPAKLLAPSAKRKPADKRDVSRDDQQALEAEVTRLHARMDAELPRAEFEIKLGRGDYLPKVDAEAAPV